MRLFSVMFEIVKLPLVVVKDAITLIPDAVSLQEPFEATRLQCDRIDRQLQL